MSAAKHTPEPWRVRAWQGHSVTTIVANVDPLEPLTIGDQTVVQYGLTEIGQCKGSLRDGGNEANAARIVSCVNYCVDVPADRLTEDTLQIKLDHIDRLTAERDELLAALTRSESFIAGFEGDELQDGIEGLLKVIRTAIAKVQP